MEDTPQENKEKKPENVVPRIRTFSNDIQNAVQSGNFSQANIVMAEKKRDRAKSAQGIEVEVEAENKANIGLIAGYVFVIMLFIAGGVGIFIFFQSNNSASNSSVPTRPQDNTLLGGSQSVPLLIGENDNRPLITNKIHSVIADVPSDSAFIKINPTALLLDEDKNRIDEALSLESLFVRLEMSDDGFSRLADSYIFGVHNGVNPFLLIQVNDSNESYGRLFSWEERLATDMLPFFPQLALEKEEIPNEDPVQEAPQEEVVTDTTNEEVIVEEAPEPEFRTIFNPVSAKFTDGVFYNFDSRVLYDANSNVRLVYAFITKELVVIASSPETLRDIAVELKNTTITR